jgi:hypothetical protein
MICYKVGKNNPFEDMNSGYNIEYINKRASDADEILIIYKIPGDNIPDCRYAYEFILVHRWMIAIYLQQFLSMNDLRLVTARDL